MHSYRLGVNISQAADMTEEGYAAALWSRRDLMQAVGTKLPGSKPLCVLS